MSSATNGASYLRRPVSPAIRRRTASCLTPARAQMSAAKDGTRVPTRQPRGQLRPQEARAGLLEVQLGPLDLTVRGTPSAPAFGDLGPVRARDPPLARDSTPQAHRGTPYSRFLRSVATHDIAAARGDGGGRGLLDLTPPTGILPERRPLPRQVLAPNAPSGQRHAHQDTAGNGGDKRDCGKHRQGTYAASLRAARAAHARHPQRVSSSGLSRGSSSPRRQSKLMDGWSGQARPMTGWWDERSQSPRPPRAEPSRRLRRHHRLGSPPHRLRSLADEPQLGPLVASLAGSGGGVQK